MQTYTENLKAGTRITLPTSGSVFLIDSVMPPGASVDLTLLQDGKADALLKGRKTGFKVVTQFSGLQFVSSTDCAITFIVSGADVQLGFADGASVAVPGGVAISNTPANPVPVAFSGTVTPVLGDVTVKNTDAQAVPVVQKAGTTFTVTPAAGSAVDATLKNTDATAVPVRNQALGTIVNIAPVTVGTANAALISDATLKKLRIKNTHATAKVAIGATGVTLANAAIVLNPGDVYFEDDAAGAAWFAISDTAGTVVALQGLK